MSFTRILFIFSTLITLFISCTKDDHPNAGDKLLHRVVSDNDSLISATFYYDGQKRLTKVVDSIRYGHQWETSIAYNGAGKPDKLTTLYRSPSNVIDFAVIDSLVYEGDKVVRKYQDWPYSPHAGHFILTHHYVYDAGGRFVTDFGGQTASFDNPADYTIFSYDSGDNIIKREAHNRSSGYLEKEETTIFTYNADLNPHHNTGLILYFVKGDNLLFGKHNKTKAVCIKPNVEVLTIDYTYEYDRDGVLNKMVINRSQAGTSDSTSTFDFYYR